MRKNFGFPNLEMRSDLKNDWLSSLHVDFYTSEYKAPHVPLSKLRELQLDAYVRILPIIADHSSSISAATFPFPSLGS